MLPITPTGKSNRKNPIHHREKTLLFIALWLITKFIPDFLTMKMSVRFNYQVLVDLQLNVSHPTSVIVTCVCVGVR